MQNKTIPSKAFSLIELLLVLAVFSALFLLVMPFGKELINKNRAIACADRLRAALRFARVTAITLGEPVKFCGSSDHHSCNGLWQEGQIVVTKSGKVMRVLPKIFNGDKLIWRGSYGERKSVSFSSIGFAKQGGSFYYCPGNDQQNAVAVILFLTGRARVDTKDADGETISCNF